jgi:hypothetical protein
LRPRPRSVRAALRKDEGVRANSLRLGQRQSRDRSYAYSVEEWANVSSRGPGIVKRLQLRADVMREGSATHCRREKPLGSRILLALWKELGGCVGLEAMRPEVKVARIMGYSAHATSRSEARSNQQRSTLQGPFSSASLANMIREVIAGMAAKKASDATECRAFRRRLRNLQASGAARSE